LLEEGVFGAATRCLAAYGSHVFGVSEESAVEGCSSRVDYVIEVDDEDKLLCEAKSPSVMKRFGELLPARGIELEWRPSSSLVRRILGEVSALFIFFELCWYQREIVRIVSGSETDGMVVPFLPQLLGCVPSRER
jgi:hypothetical protein